MNNPKDFLPAKYRRNQTSFAGGGLKNSVNQDGGQDNDQNKDNDQDKNNEQDSKKSANIEETNIEEANTEETEKIVSSPWSDLAKEPEVPEYRSATVVEKKATGTANTVASSANHTDAFKDSQIGAKSTGPSNTFNFKKKPKVNKLAGMLMVLFLVIGVFASYLLTQQSQDTRQQASTSDPYANVSCASGYFECNVGCCGVGGTPTEGKRYSTILGKDVTWNYSDKIEDLPQNIQQAIKTELKSRGLVNDNGTIRLTENFEVEQWLNSASGKKVYEYCYPGGVLDTSKCRLVNGGYLYIGGSRAGDPCAPVLTGGGDWCQVIGGANALCSDLGLIRCICNNGVGVIGSSGQSCNDLCGGTNNICESCNTSNPPENPPATNPPNPPTPTPTKTPTPTLPPKTPTPPHEQLVCASIEMLDANNNPMTGSADSKLKLGDKVRFRCSSSGDTNINYYHEFRIWATNTNYWTYLTDTSGTVAKNVSALYTINNPGRHVVQGRICTIGCYYDAAICPTNAIPYCQDWEQVEGAPDEFNDCQTDADCAKGEYCNQADSYLLENTSSDSAVASVSGFCTKSPN